MKMTEKWGEIQGFGFEVLKSTVKPFTYFYIFVPSDIRSVNKGPRNCATIQQVLISKFAFGPECADFLRSLPYGQCKTQTADCRLQTADQG